MFAKIFNFKFNGVAEAKVAASFVSDAFGKLIVTNNMRSLNISIGKCGSLSIQTKFENSDDLKAFEVKAAEVFRDLKETMVYKEDNFAGVYIFNYEAEAIKAEVSCVTKGEARDRAKHRNRVGAAVAAATAGRFGFLRVVCQLTRGFLDPCVIALFLFGQRGVVYLFLDHNIRNPKLALFVRLVLAISPSKPSSSGFVAARSSHPKCPQKYAVWQRRPAAQKFSVERKRT